MRTSRPSDNSSTTSVFAYDNYKEYLSFWVSTQPRNGWGSRSFLAKSAGCQGAYVSQVLAGHLHFSLEQATALSDALGHAPEEKHYFLLLVQEARAGTAALKRYFSVQLEELRKKKLELRNRLGVAPALDEKAQHQYYSSWIYAAAHVATDIPELQTRGAIARHLGLSLAKTSEVLDFLVESGLVENEGDRFRMSKKAIHLGSDAASIIKHHTNWRQQAIHSLDTSLPQDLHYSSAITLSRSDQDKVREKLIETIKAIKATVRTSAEESLHCFSIDLFEINQTKKHP